ncbi:hypothetical protein [Colwellia sp. BRX10-4]|uniref:hypothetical protein n=1 Tax=Colwellia sp. BRX10-4 TaxID=2759843 RepID=UPI0015F69035|nr:hypothetical protein [Colwellia sp. BRX10-4]MBA6397598.1 hypothetical protein [Colwellia sp. BRX10-4]
MEEITRIAKKYLYTTINVKHFDLLVAVLLFFSLCIAAAIGYLIAIEHWIVNTPLMIIFMVTLGLFARPAKSRYENNLSEYLQQIVNDNKIEDLQALKAKYLRQLTSAVGSTNYEALKNINYLQEQLHSYRPFTPDNLGYYFWRFLYNSEAKPRILSLFIFLLSIIVLLMVTKSDIKTNPAEVWQYMTSEFFSAVLSWGMFSLLLLFWCGYMAISFINIFIIRPFVLVNANNNFAINYLVSDLARYSFMESPETRRYTE